MAFEPERGFLRAKATVTLRASEPLEAIEFELNPKLEIREVTDGQGRRLAFDRSRRLGSPRLLVRLAEPCGAEQGVTLTFTYEGAPQLPASGLDYIGKDGILLRDEARWYPAVDLAAFTDNLIQISVPSRWTAMTSGASAGSIGYGLGATYSWKTSRPVSSRSIVAMPQQPWRCVPEPIHKGTHSEIQPLSACFHGPGEDSGRRLAAQAHELLKRYAEAFGSYPHAEIRIVQGFPGQRGAVGYSAPGFLVVSEDVAKYFDAPGYAPEFLPHEIAHQWFPGEVTLESEADGWLAESLAEYLAWRHLLVTSPGEARAMVARAMRDAPTTQPLLPLRHGLRLFALAEWDATYANLYQRGLLVFRTLETVIGRQRVDAALRELYQRHAGKTASIADFRRICEEISGRDLGWFFGYFLDGTQLPEIELRRLPAAGPNEYAGEIVFRNVPAEFQARVEMRLHTPRGPVDHSVATRGEVTPFTVTLPAPATGITLDPDARILRWTEAARRSRRQREALAEAVQLELEHRFSQALAACQRALQADPENLAVNHQQIYFLRGRLRYRLGHLSGAMQEFDRVLALSSLDRQASDFFRAWGRVYRARIERRRGHPRAARAEARAGLAINSPALHTPITWPESPQKKSTALDELRALAQ